MSGRHHHARIDAWADLTQWKLAVFLFRHLWTSFARANRIYLHLLINSSQPKCKYTQLQTSVYIKHTPYTACGTINTRMFYTYIGLTTCQKSIAVAVGERNVKIHTSESRIEGVAEDSQELLRRNQSKTYTRWRYICIVGSLWALHRRYCLPGLDYGVWIAGTCNGSEREQATICGR